MDSVFQGCGTCWLPVLLSSYLTYGWAHQYFDVKLEGISFHTIVIRPGFQLSRKRKGTIVADGRWKSEDLGFWEGKFGRVRKQQVLSRRKWFGQKRAGKHQDRGRKGIGDKVYWRARVFHPACGHRGHPDVFDLDPTWDQQNVLRIIVLPCCVCLAAPTLPSEQGLLPLQPHSTSASSFTTGPPTTTLTSSRHSIPLVYILILLCILFLPTPTHTERVKRNQWRISSQWNDG